MKHLLWMIIILLSLPTWANSKLTVSVEPKKPIVNETFTLVFKVVSENARNIEEINFKYPGLTVIGQSQQTVSTRTVYANGQLTVTRELTIIYELQADNFGVKFLRDIRVKVDGNELTHPMVSFEVLKEPLVKPEVFVMADVPKTDLFVGEGVVVRYYLYSKVSVSNLDIKKYPKLNRFLKRYLQEPDRSERVEVDGELYIRNLIYAAKLFPEKAGTLKVDPVSLSVTYARRNTRNDPFNVFASPRDMRTRTISSEVINLNVLPWPTPVPKHFTGLVGKHDFSLNMNQTKLVVNQPLEITLTVSGPGALENFEAPKVLENSALEEFESHGELRIQDTNMATKVFTYTFLASAPLELADKKLSYSYLDPVSAQYVEVVVVRDALQVGGQARAELSKTTSNSPVDQENSSGPQKLKELKNITTDVAWSKWQIYINTGLGVMALILLLSFSGLKMKRSISSRAIVPSHFKKNFNYHEFIKWMSPAIAKETKSPKELLSDLEISAEAQKYFIDLMNSSDASKFSIGKKDYKYSYKEKYFKELASKIEKYYESHS